jgi:hypothetical protein
MALDLERPIVFGDASPGHSDPVSGSIPPARQRLNIR